MARTVKKHRGNVETLHGGTTVVYGGNARGGELLGVTPRGWLRDANRALGGVTPLSCLDTEPGRQRVGELPCQIGYGVYS